MRKLQQGDFVRLNNDEIPRHIELLRVNGFEIWEDQEKDFSPNDDIIFFSVDGDFLAGNSKNHQSAITELSKHDWVCAVIGLEVGMGMRSDMSTPEQRKHITEQLDELGVRTPIPVNKRDSFDYPFHLEEEQGWIANNGVNVHIPYSEWCKKLGIDEIYADNARIGSYASENDLSDIKGALSDDSNLISNSNITLQDGTTVDLTKPIEVSDNNVNWTELLTHDEVENPHFIGVTKTGQYCFDLGTNFPAVYICKSVRNTPEPKFKEGDPIFINEFGKWVYCKMKYNVTYSGEIIHALNPDGTPNFPPFND
jgi:hypothetical protein